MKNAMVQRPAYWVLLLLCSCTPDLNMEHVCNPDSDVYNDCTLSEPGEWCMRDEHCHYMNSRCEDGVCVCYPDCSKVAGLPGAGDGCGGCCPSCTGRECGDDGCGGQCGSCGCGLSCSVEGSCVFTACAGKSCGPDGCGGSCGTCGDDDNACNGVNSCVDGACDEKPPVVCEAMDECHDAGVCNPVTGKCSSPVANEGGRCEDDGNDCNGVKTCGSGVCLQTVAPVTCTPLDACHLAGECDPATGLCTSPTGNEGSVCNDDADDCNGVSTCEDGLCVETAAPVTCQPVDTCHLAGKCDPATGICSNPAGNEGAVCEDDNNACNGVNTCVKGTCKQTVAPVSATCPGRDACHVAGECNPTTGICMDSVGNDGAGCWVSGGVCSKGNCVSAGHVAVPAGKFWMGSPDGACPAEYPGPCTPEPGRATNEALHQVTLNGPFEVQATEVTQGEWKSTFGSWNPSSFLACGEKCPVEQISWFDASAYANRRSAAAGLLACYEFSAVKCVDGKDVGSLYEQCMNAAQKGIASARVVAAGGASKPYQCTGYRLPTEAEWEYAARAESVAAYSNGSASDVAHLKCEVPFHLTDMAWYCGNAGSTTHAVGGKAANHWGLKDTGGNVYEWVWDLYQQDLSGNAVDPAGPDLGSDRVARGGSWTNVSEYCRSAHRSSLAPEFRSSSLGFRLARTLDGCVPACFEKQCGADGCGSTCGSCGCGKICAGDGKCLFTACEGRQCGPDGCGGVCGACDDGNPCTEDKCDELGQCLNLPTNEGGPCDDDGNACNGVNSCKNGVCTQKTAPVTCKAMDSCHLAGSCDPATGQCSNPLVGNGTLCDDGNKCNGVNTCVSGVCKETTAKVVCKASDVCHAVGTCNPATGQCDNPTGNEGGSCNDNVVCTKADKCTKGKCAGTSYSCSGHGTCNGTGCNCSSGFGGTYCNQCASGHVGYPYCISQTVGWYDAATKKIWQVAPPSGTYIWESANTYCNILNLGGFPDWRLPSISELRSIIRGCEDTVTGGLCGVKDSCLKNSCMGSHCGYGCTGMEGPDNGCYWVTELNGTCFWYWSSSYIEADRAGSVWEVDFTTGAVNRSDRANTDSRFRCVMDAQ